MSILGGKATIARPVVGAVICIAINGYLVAQPVTTELNIAGTGPLSVLALLSFRKGIADLPKDLGKRRRIWRAGQARRGLPLALPRQSTQL